MSLLKIELNLKSFFTHFFPDAHFNKTNSLNPPSKVLNNCTKKTHTNISKRP